MRMRKKPNLAIRMERCAGMLVSDPAAMRGRWRELFPAAREVRLEGSFFPVQLVSVGNPHAVIFCGDLDAIDLEREGPRLETYPGFPGRVNVEFATLLRPDLLDVRDGSTVGLILTAISGDSEREVEAASKKAGAARDREAPRGSTTTAPGPD